MRKPCCDKQDTNKGAWSKQEDQKLVDYIRKHGEGCWRTLPLAAGLLRCGKSCRLRWINYLRPDLKRGNFAEDEEDLIIKLHALLGNRWSLIAGRLPGRSDNEVKNYWNSHLRRKLINMGIDPNNHRPGQKVAVPRPPQSQHHDSDSATSSGSKKDHPSQVPVKIRDNNNNNNKVHDSDSATSSGSKKDHPSQVPVKIRDNNNKVSDAGSCLEDDHGPCSSLPDLNLDLSITISPSPSIHKFYQMEQKPNTSMVHGNNCAPSPPLLLFG